MIQEILILRTVFLMTVDEAFYETEKIRQKEGNLLYMQTAVAKLHSETNSNKVSVKHLRINSAACRRLLALLRAFIPRHPDWITITLHTHTCIH